VQLSVVILDLDRPRLVVVVVLVSHVDNGGNNMGVALRVSQSDVVVMPDVKNRK
jgi:hypothetical protein